MAGNYFITLPATLLLCLFAAGLHTSSARLVQEPPTVLNYHNGVLLKGTVTVNLIWYGKFSPAQRSTIVDFLTSLNSWKSNSPSAASWWKITGKYGGGGSSNIAVGKQIFDENCSQGKSIKNDQLPYIASWGGNSTGTVNLVLTATDVYVDGFCSNRCGTHGSSAGKSRAVYAWVGNSESQCPGYCAWPFHQPIYGPQSPPLIPPNGDVGVDGMIISLATVLAGAVTNPYKNGYFEGVAAMPLEAVSACTGIFGSGAYSGYPGQVLVDKSTGASFNAYGVNGRKFLIPAMWDPQSSTCSPPV
ncbi:unnamed protein product [Cuscuta epithymum]|uniref:Protein EXORDIUM-like 2 n=1 Tax=Cuscuta epithymum TaxID=186058 RepID=A0AAV0F562_9ASTE|nr:unnamed protein product [Cuscuta epithymum]